MSISSKTLLDIARKGATSGVRGEGLFIKRHAARPDSGVGPAVRKFGDDLTDVATPQRVTPYDHPARTRFSGIRVEGPLQPSELAWLTRLPDDPTAISHADAGLLAAIAGSLPDIALADKKIVESIWGPVRRLHDIEATKVELAALREGRGELPESIVGALTEAIAHEVPELTTTEAGTRARDALAQVATERAWSHDRTVARVQARLTELQSELEGVPA